MNGRGRPPQAPAASTNASESTPFGTAWFSGLRRRDRPAAQVPGPLRRLLPDPMREAGRQRFLHADVRHLSPLEVARELERLRIAVALVEDVDQVPVWVVTRVRVLLEALQGAA